MTGQGRPLVLLHGWGTHARVWQGLVPALSERFQVYAVNLPGYGASPDCTPYTPEALVDVLARALPGGVRVCGWSLGAQLALAWACLRPAQVEALVLVAATPCFVNRPGWDCGTDEVVLRGFARDLEADYATTMQRFLSLQARGAASLPAALRPLRRALAEAGRPSLQALRGGLQLLLRSDWRGRLGQIAPPTLLVHGDRDLLTPPCAAHALARGLPDGRLALIEGAAHAPFLSHPETVLRQMTDFFDAVIPGPPEPELIGADRATAGAASP